MQDFDRKGDNDLCGGTAGSHYAARLLRRASAGSSPKALLAAAVAATNPLFESVLSITCAVNPSQKYLWGTLGAQVSPLCLHLRG